MRVTFLLLTTLFFIKGYSIAAEPITYTFLVRTDSFTAAQLNAFKTLGIRKSGINFQITNMSPSANPFYDYLELTITSKALQDQFDSYISQRKVWLHRRTQMLPNGRISRDAKSFPPDFFNVFPSTP